MITSAPAAQHEGSRPPSALAALGASHYTIMPTNAGETSWKSSLSVTGRMNETITSAASFSASLDQESRPEEPPSLQETSREPVVLPFFFESFSQTSENEKNKGSSIPKLKLKPRLNRKKKDSLAWDVQACSYETPTPKILIPFLPLRSIQHSSQSRENSQRMLQQKTLPPLPPIPQLPMQFTSAPATPERPKKTPRTINDPLSLRRQKKAKLTRSDSAPLSLPPQLTPSFDFGIISTNSTRNTTCKTPLNPKHPAAPFTTPSSVTINRIIPPSTTSEERPFTTPLSATINRIILPSMTSEERVNKSNNWGGFLEVPGGVAKPIAMRPFITPSNNCSTSINRTRSASFSGDYYCTPRSIYPRAYNNRAATLSSSGQYSAFSFSSVLSPSSTPIWRA